MTIFVNSKIKENNYLLGGIVMVDGTLAEATDNIIVSEVPGTFTSSVNTLYSNLFPFGKVLEENVQIKIFC